MFVLVARVLSLSPSPFLTCSPKKQSVCLCRTSWLGSATKPRAFSHLGQAVDVHIPHILKDIRVEAFQLVPQEGIKVGADRGRKVQSSIQGGNRES